MTRSNQTPKKHVLYIDPQETVTDVRERLNGINATEITVIVPMQTQLGHAIDWKLLARHGQQLGKKMLIVSENPRICSLARAMQLPVRSLSMDNQQHSPSVSRSRRR